MSLDAFYHQQVRKIVAKLSKIDYPELEVINGNIVKLDSNFGKHDESYEIEFVTKLGAAALLADCAHDMPTVEAFVERRAGKFKRIANHIKFCLEDVERADEMGVDLDSMKAAVAQEILLQQADQILLVGLASAGLYGLLNQPNATITNLPADGQLGVINPTNSVRWADKTSEQIYRDMCLFNNTPRVLSNGRVFYDTNYIDLENYDIISTRPASGLTNGETILSYFLKTQASNPMGVRRVLPMAYLRGEGAGGANLMLGLSSREGHIKGFVKRGINSHSYTDRTDYCTRFTQGVGSIVMMKQLSLGYATI